MKDCSGILAALPVPAYTCDAEGLLTGFNAGAARAWGWSPPLRDPAQRWCGSYRLHAADGTPMPHEQCWAAMAAKKRRPFNGRGVIVERPDGARSARLAYANPVPGEKRAPAGVINVLISRDRASSADAVSARARRRFRESLAGLLGDLDGSRADGGAGVAPLIALCRVGAGSGDVAPAEIPQDGEDISEAAALGEAIGYARAAIAGAAPRIRFGEVAKSQVTAGVRVLLVDDHAPLRGKFAELLDAEDDLLVVAEASDGMEGIRLSREFWPDVVVMDYSMPGMKGDAATREIRSTLPNVAVVALSLHDDKGIRGRMQEAGAAEFILKSHASGALPDVIRKAAATLSN